MQYKDYNIKIVRQTSHVETVSWEGNIKLMSPDHHQLVSQSFTITLKWIEQPGEMNNQNVSNRRITFYNVDEFDRWINNMISSCDNSNSSFRDFLAWSEARLNDVKAMQTVK